MWFDTVALDDMQAVFENGDGLFGTGIYRRDSVLQIPQLPGCQVHDCFGAEADNIEISIKFTVHPTHRIRVILCPVIEVGKVPGTGSRMLGTERVDQCLLNRAGILL